MTTMFRSEMTFVKAVHVDELIVMHQVQRPSVQNWSLAIGHDGTDPAPTVIEFTYTTPRGLSSTNQTWHIPTGAWFGAWSSDQLGQAAIYFNRGVPMLLHALAPRTGGNMLQLKVANISNTHNDAGTVIVSEVATFAAALDSTVRSLADLHKILKQIVDPTGLQVWQGTRQVGPQFAGLLELLPDPRTYVTELSVDGTPEDKNMQNAARVSGFQRRWTVGMFQDAGYPGAGNHYGSEDYKGHCTDWCAGV